MENKVGNVMLGKIIAITIVFSCLLVGNQAQEQQQQQCIEPLRFCISFLNTTSQPPDSCCQPLDYIVKSLPNCFCNLISTLVVNRKIETKDIDVSKAQTLPSRCGQRIDPLECITGTSAQSNNPTPNYANSKSWDYSSLVITMAASSIILNFQAL